MPGSGSISPHPDRKRRMGFLAIYELREMRTNAEERRMQADADEAN